MEFSSTKGVSWAAVCAVKQQLGLTEPGWEPLLAGLSVVSREPAEQGKEGPCHL